VPAGSYAFFVIPSKSGNWTLILNKDTTQAGTGANYKQELDLLRVGVKPQSIRMRERLGYQILDFDDFHATLALDWEKIRLSLPIQVGTDEQVQTSISALDSDAWRAWNSAARYELESKKDYDAGLKLIEKSLQMKEDWLNLWTKAQLLAAKGNHKDAYPLAQRANELGQKAPQFFFADDVKKALTDWKGK
jgi:tetratricopeptide (TPR) repeat protein